MPAAIARLALVLPLLALLPAPASAAPLPAEAIRSGDIERVTEAVVGVYEAAGLTWNPAIEWTVGPFTTTYWWYDPFGYEILVGDLPRADQVDTYWLEWSRVLTDGRFNPNGFFASPAEAAELAAYNQFVLATHEAAHAVTYRYDDAHLERHGYAVNCREYYADRLTVGILGDEARRDPDMQRWRDRYHELVVAMGRTIPDRYRQVIPDFAALDADCALIDIAQPTPDTMQPYAAAFFERYRVLLDADLPPLAELAETHLLARHRAEFEKSPLLPDRERFAVTTLADVSGAELNGFDLGIGDSAMASRKAAFAPDGTLYFAVLDYDRDSRQLSFGFGTEVTPTPIVEPDIWARPSVEVELTGLAVMGPDHFFFCLDHRERDAAENDLQFVMLLEARRTNGEWGITGISNDESGQCAVHRTPGGKLFYLLTPEQLTGVASPDWEAYEIDIVTHDVVDTQRVGAETTAPLAIDDEANVYLGWGYNIWRVAPDGNGGLLVGSGLRGPRDGIADGAQFADVVALQWLEDRSALLLDTFDQFSEHKLRRLSLAP